MPTHEKDLRRIYRTPVTMLTDAEVELLDPQSRAWARKVRERKAREDACPGHDRILISTLNGWRAAKCRHCGMDMSGPY